MQAIVLFITSLGIDLIVDITLSLNCSYVSVVICIGNYTVREVLMENRTRVWRNVYN